MKIGLVAYPGCVASGAFAFSELLEAANQRAAGHVFEVLWVGIDGKEVQLNAARRGVDALIRPDSSLDDKSLDALLIPGFWTNGESDLQQALKRYERLTKALASVNPRTQLWSYCTAVCLLAEARHLEGKRATSTWWLTDFLTCNYAAVDWRFSRACVSHSNAITASGVNGYLPIAQSLIEKTLGHNVLRDVIDLMVVPKPEKNEGPLGGMNIVALDEPIVRRLYRRVEETPASELTVARIAVDLHKTERTLARHVKAVTGVSCAQLMRLIKVNQASDYLVYSSKAISQISEHLGFTDDTSFRRSFKKATGYAPFDYRMRFGRFGNNQLTSRDST